MSILPHGGRSVAALASAISVAALVATATAPAPAHASDRTTFLLSRSFDGGFPNGSSRNPTFSHDQRIARVAAYESDASNIVRGDANNATDVFTVRRRGPWGSSGTPWAMGATELASTGMGGQPANGPSSRPVLDGDSHHAPRCVAFISSASNLVRGDTNGKSDVFVRALAGGAIKRVSVDSKGRQANGAS